MDPRSQNPPPLNQFQPATQYNPAQPQYGAEYTSSQQYNTQYTTSPQYNTQYPMSQQTNTFNPNEGFCGRTQRNKAQFNSVGSGTFIFMSGGINLAWSLQLITFDNIRVDLHIKICWFIAVIIGAFICAPLSGKVSKKILMLCSSALVTLGGILIISAPSKYNAFMAARYIDGLAVGIIFAPIMVMVADESNSYVRGMIASSTESFGFAAGIFVQLAYGSSLMQYDIFGLSTTQVHGVLSIIFGLVAMLMAFLLVIESPVYHLMRHDEQQAIDCLRRLQRPFTITAETHAQLQELKCYIAEQNELTFAEGLCVGFPALLKVCLYRGMIAISYSFLTNAAFTIVSVMSAGTMSWPFVVYGVLRLTGAVTGFFMIDPMGRKKTLLATILICGAMSISLGVIFPTTTNIDTAMYLLFILQFFVGLFASISSAYLCEAFPMVVRPYYIATAISVEMLVHIIILSTATTQISGYFYTVGILSFVFAVIGFWCLPETKYMTLRDAEAKFRGLFGSAGF